jgi:hypothetical protein
MDDVLGRMWEHLGGRVGGPLTLRLVLQPLMAIFLAVRDGIDDGRAGRPPYTWEVATSPEHRRELLREGWRAFGKVFVLAVVLDCVYQYIVFGWLYPIEALLVAVVLACVPYLLVRGPVGRLSRWVTRA